MKSSGFSNFETGPLWVWLIFGNSFFYLFCSDCRYKFKPDDLSFRFNFVALSSWQITRLQIKANE